MFERDRACDLFRTFFHVYFYLVRALSHSVSLLQRCRPCSSPCAATYIRCMMDVTDYPLAFLRSPFIFF